MINISQFNSIHVTGRVSSMFRKEMGSINPVALRGLFDKDV